MYNLRRIYNTLVINILFRHYSEYPVYVFHHIPKCGGSSLLKVLNRWFRVVHDYRESWGKGQPRKIDLSKLKCIHCLSGHFDHDGIYLFQRYPEVMNSNNYRLITFLRDPLQTKLSLYRFEKSKRGDSVALTEHLFSRPNYMSNRFPLTKTNYKQILDSYFFVGVIEKAQECVDFLSMELDKKTVKMPIVNATAKSDSVRMQGGQRRWKINLERKIS